MLANILIGIGLIIVFERLLSAISSKNQNSSNNVKSYESNQRESLDESDYFNEESERKIKTNSLINEINGVTKIIKDFYKNK